MQVLQPNSLNTLESMIKEFREHEDYELEVCIRYPGNESLCEEDYNELKDRIDASNDREIFKLVATAQQCNDVFFKNDVRLRCCEIGKFNAVEKRRLNRVTGIASHGFLHSHRFVFNLKHESELDRTKINMRDVPLCVRVQTIWTYNYNDCYEYSFKRVRQGKTREEAMKNPEIFELEVELKHEKTYLDSRTDAHIAQSLMAKVLGLCKNTTATGTSRKLQIEFLPWDELKLRDDQYKNALEKLRAQQLAASVASNTDSAAKDVARPKPFVSPLNEISALMDIPDASAAKRAKKLQLKKEQAAAKKKTPKMKPEPSTDEDDEQTLQQTAPEHLLEEELVLEESKHESDQDSSPPAKKQKKTPDKRQKSNKSTAKSKPKSLPQQRRKKGG